jgi:hypothetical protein
MHHLDDFGLDVNERGALVCPPCAGATLRRAGPVYVLALESIHEQEILLMVDAPLYAALRGALDVIADDVAEAQARPRRHALK